MAVGFSQGFRLAPSSSPASPSADRSSPAVAAAASGAASATAAQILFGRPGAAGSSPEQRRPASASAASARPSAVGSPASFASEPASHVPYLPYDAPNPLDQPTEVFPVSTSFPAAHRRDSPRTAAAGRFSHEGGVPSANGTNARDPAAGEPYGDVPARDVDTGLPPGDAGAAHLAQPRVVPGDAGRVSALSAAAEASDAAPLPSSQSSCRPAQPAQRSFRAGPPQHAFQSVLSFPRSPPALQLQQHGGMGVFHAAQQRQGAAAAAAAASAAGGYSASAVGGYSAAASPGAYSAATTSPGAYSAATAGGYTAATAGHLSSSYRGLCGQDVHGLVRVQNGGYAVTFPPRNCGGPSSAGLLAVDAADPSLGFPAFFYAQNHLGSGSLHHPSAGMLPPLPHLGQSALVNGAAFPGAAPLPFIVPQAVQLPPGERRQPLGLSGAVGGHTQNVHGRVALPGANPVSGAPRTPSNATASKTGTSASKPKGASGKAKPASSRNKEFACGYPGCAQGFKRLEHLKRHHRSVHTNEKRAWLPGEGSY
ncbi:MAG: hypothetical protein BJ554DRAFT_2177 [Olpidium bornovanus]|uniref:C2H2-type domain-containing protein n=1 Tax=Olpidium bornovanus TaxID=278681 RepID=A0A8H7ZR67_9FUNG|nr:MAG: hypothetical protein BJ554DRAFT_2177 [Olpidium bornovanus]